jgi:hypothetical protein
MKVTCAQKPLTKLSAAKKGRKDHQYLNVGRSSWCYFTLYKRITLSTNVCFSNIYYHTGSQASTVSGINVLRLFRLRLWALITRDLISSMYGVKKKNIPSTNRIIGGKCCLHLQGRQIRHVRKQHVTGDNLSSFDSLQTTRHFNPLQHC